MVESSKGNIYGEDMKSSLKKPIIKTITWTVVVISTSTLIIYLLTGKPYVSLGIASGIEGFQLFLYGIHEFIWHKYG